MAQSEKYILFQLAGQTFAVHVEHVISIERLQPVTAVPHSKVFIKGVTEIRNETTAIIDLRERLHLPVAQATDQTRILVVMIEGMQVGFIVDRAEDVRDLSTEQIKEAPLVIADIRNTFLEGIYKLDEELILLIDIEKLLDFDETNEVRKVIGE